MRFLCFILLFLFGFSSLFSSCGFSEQDDNILVVGVETEPKVLDPRYATDALSSHLCELLYDGVLRRNDSLRLVPRLAKSVEQLDEKTYRIVLRKGVFFHDGRKLTAEDVRYTYESLLSPASTSPKRGDFMQLAGIDVLDEQTLVLHLKASFASFPDALTMGIVPEGSGDLSEKPVGSGPFSFERRVKGKEVLLRANRDYWGVSPLLKGVLFKVIPDETVRLLELKKGSVHLVGNPLTPAIIPWLQEQEGIEVKTATGTNVSYIGFNMRDAILKDARVRRAVALAIDRDSIIASYLRGFAKRADSLFAPANPYHDEGIHGEEYDPRKAMELLDEAGYPQPADGSPRFRLSFKTSKNPSRKKLAEIFAEQLRKVGIDVEIKSMEWGSFFGDIKQGNFQLYSLTWVGVADPDILYYIFHSESTPPEGGNRGGYVNHKVDKLLEKARVTADFKQRKRLYDEAQRLIVADYPYRFLWYSENVYAMSKRVQGFSIAPDESYASLVQVSLHPSP